MSNFKIRATQKIIQIYAIAALLGVSLIGCGGGNRITPHLEAKLSSVLASPPEENTPQFSGSRNSHRIRKDMNGNILVWNWQNQVVTLPSTTKSINFTDFKVNLTIAETIKQIEPIKVDALIELYIAYFSRVPDADGLEYWIKEFHAGHSLEEIGKSFYAAALQSPELTRYASTISNTDFVTRIYKNVLHRDPDTDGLNYWVKSLDTGIETRGSLVKTMLSAAKTTKPGTEFGWVKELLEKQVEFSRIFAIEQGLNYRSFESNIRETTKFASKIFPSDYRTPLSSLGKLDWGVLSIDPPEIDIPIVPQTYAYVVAQDVLSAMPELITQFRQVTCTGLCKKSILIVPSNNPEDLRKQLKSIGDLKLAFLIGDVPKILETRSNGFSDHYFRALNARYGSPTEFDPGRFKVDPPSNFSLGYSRVTNASARITGGFKGEEEVNYVRKYLIKNIAKRTVRGVPVHSYFSMTTNQVVNESNYLKAFENHPLYTINQVHVRKPVDAQSDRQGFINCLTQSGESCEINVHGSPNGILFTGTGNYGNSWITSEEIGKLDIRAQFLRFVSCSVGNFSVPNFLAAVALGTGDTLLVQAYSADIGLWSDYEPESVYHQSSALGVGRTHASSYTFTSLTSSVDNFFGDPTIPLRMINLSLPRPKLLINNKRQHQEFKEIIDFGSPSSLPVKKIISLKNKGDKDLVIFAAHASYGIDENDPSDCYDGFELINHPDYNTIRGTYALIIPPNGYVELQFAFKQKTLWPSNKPISGKCNAYFSFSSNDPEIGNFGLELRGTLPKAL